MGNGQDCCVENLLTLAKASYRPDALNEVMVRTCKSPKRILQVSARDWLQHFIAYSHRFSPQEVHAAAVVRVSGPLATCLLSGDSARCRQHEPGQRRQCAAQARRIRFVRAKQ
jgi:hypothetical protein